VYYEHFSKHIKHLHMLRSGCRLYGVEIVEGATSVECACFTGHACAFMMGNEGSGMNKPQVRRRNTIVHKTFCSHFILLIIFALLCFRCHEGVDFWSPARNDLWLHFSLLFWYSRRLLVLNKQLEACDEFLIIPQFGNGTASLNVSNAAAIVLEHFALQRAGISIGTSRDL